jgi:hypothetical protein
MRNYSLKRKIGRERRRMGTMKEIEKRETARKENVGVGAGGGRVVES